MLLFRAYSWTFIQRIVSGDKKCAWVIYMSPGIAHGEWLTFTAVQNIYLQAGFLWSTKSTSRVLDAISGLQHVAVYLGSCFVLLPHFLPGVSLNKSLTHLPLGTPTSGKTHVLWFWVQWSLHNRILPGQRNADKHWILVPPPPGLMTEM